MTASITNLLVALLFIALTSLFMWLLVSNFKRYFMSGDMEVYPAPWWVTWPCFVASMFLSCLILVMVI